MNSTRLKKLMAAGWAVGNADDFLGSLDGRAALDSGVRRSDDAIDHRQFAAAKTPGIDNQSGNNIK